MDPEQFAELKTSKDTVMLVHNYQRPEIQDLADYLGDSLNLAMEATRVKQSQILFCGVDFMAESAKILNPTKKVLHPNTDAKCPMAAMIDPEGLRNLKAENPEAVVVAYVNTTDVTTEQIEDLKERYPGKKVLIHPECIPDVLDLADEVLSTEGMVRYAKSSDDDEFIIITERELAYRLEKENPDKTFHVIERAICPAMKKVTLDDVVKCLETGTPEIELNDTVLEQARLPLERMLAVGRGEKLDEKL
jgi:quinolinate synthase